MVVLTQLLLFQTLLIIKRMKKVIFFLGLIFSFSYNSNAEFFYNVCRIVLDNGGGNYAAAPRNVEDHFDLNGKLIGQDVTINCYGNGSFTCPTTIEPPGGGNSGDLPSNIFLYCDQLFGNLCDGVDDNLFPATISVLGSDNIVYYITATITEIEGGKKYNLMIYSN